ncbi:MAG: FAD-dependent oxidoreductase [Myxococcota bacterium]
MAASQSEGANPGARYLARIIGPLVRWWVPRRLGGYKQRVDAARPDLPERLPEPKTAAVVGAGLAGFAAAHTLAKRGFSVTLFEKNAHLGGKLGSWTVDGPDGERLPVSHGYHAFFRNYYNLRRFLAEVGADRHFAPISDYLCMRASGNHFSFGKMEQTPILNMLHLADTGLYNFKEIYLTPARNHMGIFMEYDVDITPAKYDGTSFVEFAEKAHIPEGLKLAFNIFSRAFFADEDRLSMAELLKSFHFYYLSNDHGLVYDYPTKDYQASMLGPIVEALESHGVQLRPGTPIERIERRGDGLTIHGEHFDHAVIATDVVGTRRIVEASPGLVLPDAEARLTQLRPGQSYAVLRVWIDKDPTEDTPVFVITDRVKVLDAVAIYHRVEDEARDWAQKHGGGVIELHCYALPDGVEDEAEIRSLLLEELPAFFPSLEGMEIRFEWMQVETNFTAFHVGMDAQRPRVEDGGDRLSFAGDWVKLPFPAMLMEAAASSGVVAANRALSAEGVQEEPVYSVPPRGLLARRPARNALLSDGGRNRT